MKMKNKKTNPIPGSKHPLFLTLFQFLMVMVLAMGFVKQARADFDFKSAVEEFSSELTNNWRQVVHAAEIACVIDLKDQNADHLRLFIEFKEELSFDFRSTLAYLLFTDKTLDELTSIFNSLVLKTLEKYPCPDTQRTSAVKILDHMFRSVLSPLLPSPYSKENQMRSQSPYFPDPSESNREIQSRKFGEPRPLSSELAN